MSAKRPERKLSGMNSFLSTSPPLVFLAGPWLFLGLVLSGPFLLLLTVIVVALAVTILPVALAATPYLLVQRYRNRAEREPVVLPHTAFELRRVAA
jgi:hypothetical protein